MSRQSRQTNEVFFCRDSNTCSIIMILLVIKIATDWDSDNWYILDMNYYTYRAYVGLIVANNLPIFHVSLEYIQVISARQFVASLYLVTLNTDFNHSRSFLFHMPGHICVYKYDQMPGDHRSDYILFWFFKSWLWPERIFYSNLTMDTDVTLSRHADDCGFRSSNVFAGLLFLDYHRPLELLLSHNINGYTDKCTWT